MTELTAFQPGRRALPCPQQRAFTIADGKAIFYD